MQSAKYNDNAKSHMAATGSGCGGGYFPTKLYLQGYQSSFVSGYPHACYPTIGGYVQTMQAFEIKPR